MITSRTISLELESSAMSAVGAARTAERNSVCFGSSKPAAPMAVIDASGLLPEIALALSNALPFLRCGEESAVHAFGRRLVSAAGSAESAALDSITLDEIRHAAWLEALAAALPAPDRALHTSAMVRFFKQLLTREPALHFARIAALDLAVCALLRPLVARRSVLASAPEVFFGLRSIRHDESRHVRVARACARRLGLDAARQRQIDIALRHELSSLLQPVHPSLRCLGIRELG